MGNHYSPSEFLKTAYSLVITKLAYPQARLVRRPIFIRGGVQHQWRKKPYNGTLLQI